MLAHFPNTRRATPERVLWLFTAFALLAALSAVRDGRRRAAIESTVPVTDEPVVPGRQGAR